MYIPGRLRTGSNLEHLDVARGIPVLARLPGRRGDLPDERRATGAESSENRSRLAPASRRAEVAALAVLAMRRLRRCRGTDQLPEHAMVMAGS